MFSIQRTSVLVEFRQMSREGFHAIDTCSKRYKRNQEIVIRIIAHGRLSMAHTFLKHCYTLHLIQVVQRL